MTGIVSQRLDLWLWHARFFRTRNAAQRFCEDGRIRIAGNHVDKPHRQIHIGDVLTFPLGDRICVLRVLGFSTRRGSAEAARLHYELLHEGSNPAANHD